jgi:hypothetical protein
MYIDHNTGALPAHSTHMEASVRESTVLPFCETLHSLQCILRLGSRCHHLVFTALCRLEPPAETDTQGRNHRHLCGWAPVRSIQTSHHCSLSLTCTRNIATGLSRIVTVQLANMHGGVTINTVTAVVCAYAQISTAIIVACCPLLRPVFERMLPARLIRVRTPVIARVGTPILVRPTPLLTLQNPSVIQITTSIHVHNDSSEPYNSQGAAKNGPAESHAPTFDVEMSETNGRRCSRCLPC